MDLVKSTEIRAVGYVWVMTGRYLQRAGTTTARSLLQYFTSLYAQPIGQVQKLSLYTINGNENNKIYINMCAPGRILPHCAGDQVDKRY
jgi:hypothetical protein